MSHEINRDDMLDIAQYEKQRAAIREHVIAQRKLRRVHVGEIITVAFENAETVRYQIQEMMRAERMVDDAAIDFEIATYSEMLPGPNELSATLFIEIDDTERLHEWLPKLVGIEHAVSLEIAGAETAAALGEEGRSREDVTSTVHYLKIPLDDAQAGAIRTGADCALVIDQANYAARAELGTEMVAALAADLGA